MRTCEVCQAPLKTQKRFCSRRCNGLATIGKSARGTRDHKARGDRWIEPSSGYVLLYNPGRHPILEHRKVAEQTIGRPLEKGEHVHHINTDRADNRPENLRVMSASEHSRLHKIGNHYAASKAWSRHHDCCVVCGTTEQPHQAKGICVRCYLSQWYQANKISSRTT